MSYRERRTPLPLATLWQRSIGPVPGRDLILPDGCMDLLWDGSGLVVTGPDATARWQDSPAGTSYCAVRLSGGAGPAWLGVPADALRDQVLTLPTSGQHVAPVN